jgi:carboxymethylenebutenolidase
MPEAASYEEFRFPVEGGEVDGFLCRPAGPGPHPAVVLGVEAWGVNDYIRGVGRRLAENGYIAAGFDYYHGGGPKNPEDITDFPGVMAAIGSLDFRRATYDMLAIVDHVRGMPESNGEVLTWGYCTGATLALLAGCLDRTLAGTVLFYPSQPMFETIDERRPTHPIDLLWNHRPPMLLFYGDQDPVMPADVLQEFRRRLETFGIDHTVKVYPGVGHVFAGHVIMPAEAGGDGHDSYHEEYAEDAWALAMDFGRRHTSG